MVLLDLLAGQAQDSGKARPGSAAGKARPGSAGKPRSGTPKGPRTPQHSTIKSATTSSASRSGLPPYPKDDTIQQIFSHYDNDGNGGLDVRELGQALRELGLAPAPDQVHDLLKRFDMEGTGGRDGQLSLSEFQVAVRTVYEETARAVASEHRVRSGRASERAAELVKKSVSSKIAALATEPIEPSPKKNGALSSPQRNNKNRLGTGSIDERLQRQIAARSHRVGTRPASLSPAA